MRASTCGDCIHTDICKQINGGWFSHENIAYCKAFKDRTKYVEVVRCKDCKHGIWDEEEQMWECILSVDLTGDADTYAMFHEYNDGEHFCSYGERKDNG